MAIVCILSNQYYLFGKDSTGIRPAVLRKTAQLEALREYASGFKNTFFFYNANDFIASSELVFDHSISFEQMDSLGSWYMRSPAYYARNNSLGFSTSYEGLTNTDNVYYAEIGPYHCELDSFLKEKGYRMELVDSFVIDDVTIRVYHCIL